MSLGHLDNDFYDQMMIQIYEHIDPNNISDDKELYLKEIFDNIIATPQLKNQLTYNRARFLNEVLVWLKEGLSSLELQQHLENYDHLAYLHFAVQHCNKFNFDFLNIWPNLLYEAINCDEDKDIPIKMAFSILEQLISINDSHILSNLKEIEDAFDEKIKAKIIEKKGKLYKILLRENKEKLMCDLPIDTYAEELKIIYNNSLIAPNHFKLLQIEEYSAVLQENTEFLTIDVINCKRIRHILYNFYPNSFLTDITEKLFNNQYCDRNLIYSTFNYYLKRYDSKFSERKKAYRELAPYIDEMYENCKYYIYEISDSLDLTLKSFKILINIIAIRENFYDENEYSEFQEIFLGILNQEECSITTLKLIRYSVKREADVFKSFAGFFLNLLLGLLENFVVNYFDVDCFDVDNFDVDCFDLENIVIDDLKFLGKVFQTIGCLLSNCAGMIFENSFEDILDENWYNYSEDFDIRFFFMKLIEIFVKLAKYQYFKEDYYFLYKGLYLFDIGLRRGLIRANKLDGFCYDYMKDCITNVVPKKTMKYYNKYVKQNKECKIYLREQGIYVTPDEDDDDEEIFVEIDNSYAVD